MVRDRIGYSNLKYEVKNCTVHIHINHSHIVSERSDTEVRP